jgi:RNA polymerase sigma factor (sigma-70 family)
MTDSEIITSLRNNKYQQATNGLYSFFPAIKKYIRTNNGTTDDAKDIFQDALVILYKKVQSPEFTLSAPLKTYLFAVAKNCWFQELRRRNKLPAGIPTDELADTVPEEASGFQLATTAFHLLGEKCKELLILFYYKKKSYKEIATAFAFSSDKVAKNQKYRCIEKAKENFLLLSKTGNNG